MQGEIPIGRLAKENNYRSRAVYKLSQLNKSHHILKQGMKIVDIGALREGGYNLHLKYLEAKERSLGSM